MQTIDIGWLELFLATTFIVVAGIVSVLMSLGLIRSLLIATLRTYLQLIALGFILVWIFSINSAPLVLSLFSIMILLTAQTIMSRVKNRPPRLYVRTVSAIFLSAIIVTFSVIGLVIKPTVWYDPRYLLTIGGMILGNSMNGVALTLERLFDDLHKRTAEVNQTLAFGGTLWEVSLPSIRTALIAGLLPTINSMNAVGLVFIPGMMTGQLLAGAEPMQAAKYQVVVMLMISAATALGAMGTILLCYEKAFNTEWQLQSF